MLSDPIADYLTRIRNALISGHDRVDVPASGLKLEMTRILAEQGYITAYETRDGEVGSEIRITLKYSGDRRPVLTGLQRVSRPGRRRYVGRYEVPRVHGGTGTAIVSTSHGVMTGHEARSTGVGGEVVAYVW